MNENSELNENRRKILISQISSSDSVELEKRNVNGKWISILFCFVASLGYVSCGTLVAWSSNSYKKINNTSIAENTNDQTLLTSIVALAASVSAILAYKFYFYIGTKKLMVASASCLIISSYLTSFGSLFWYVFLGRLLGGLGMGVIFTLVPQYVEELSSKRYKQQLETILYSQFAIGILIQYATDFLPDIQMAGVLTGAFAIFLFIGFLFMPESPKFLCYSGKADIARVIMKVAIFKENQTIEDKINTWQHKHNIDIKYADFFKELQNVFILVPIIGLTFFQQSIGIMTLFFYLHTIFSKIDSYFSPTVNCLIVATVFVLSIQVGRLFRRILKYKTNLIVTSTGMLVCLAALGYIYHSKAAYFRSFDIHYTGTILFSTTIFIYGIGFNHLPWKYMEKLVPENNQFAIRSLMVSISWSLVYLFVSFTPYLIALIEVGWVFWNMSVVLFFALLFIGCFVPDLQESSIPNKLFDNTDSLTDDDDENSSSPINLDV